MYWNTGEYPEIKDLSRAEGNRIVSAAFKRYGGGIWIRFTIALLSTVLTPVIIALFCPQFSSWVTAIISGFLFYIYLLAEINGPAHRAVQSFLSDGQEV
jgi:hypothetical protein